MQQICWKRNAGDDDLTLTYDDDDDGSVDSEKVWTVADGGNALKLFQQ